MNANTSHIQWLQALVIYVRTGWYSHTHKSVWPCTQLLVYIDMHTLVHIAILLDWNTCTYLVVAWTTLPGQNTQFCTYTQFRQNNGTMTSDWLVVGWVTHSFKLCTHSRRALIQFAHSDTNWCCNKLSVSLHLWPKTIQYIHSSWGNLETMQYFESGTNWFSQGCYM